MWWNEKRREGRGEKRGRERREIKRERTYLMRVRKGTEGNLLNMDGREREIGGGGS